MATLHFKNKNLQSLLRLTEQATSFHATHTEAIRAYKKDTGLKYQFDKDIDLSHYKKGVVPWQ